MRKLIFFLCAFVIFTKCNYEKLGQYRKDIYNQIIEKHKPVSDLDLKNLSGIWAENENENALFWILEDSMYSVEHLGEKVKINTHLDTLFVYYEGITTTYRVLKLDADSLVLLNEVSDTIRLHKRK
ncbi:MAG: hypothetical protein FD155_388 [Bacteroidetes bacterium]|nr:MAG: hypothetical protein FD155_388 [Bacteroidota bacterium]